MRGGCGSTTGGGKVEENNDVNNFNKAINTRRCLVANRNVSMLAGRDGHHSWPRVPTAMGEGVFFHTTRAAVECLPKPSRQMRLIIVSAKSFFW